MTASGGVGDLPVQPTAPTVVEFPLREHLATRAPWAIGFCIPWAVVLGLLFLRENRSWQARLPVIVVVSIGLLFFLIRSVIGGFPASAFLTPFLALCIFWLYTPRLAQKRPASAVLVSLFIAVCVGVCGLLILKQAGDEALLFIIAYSFAMVVHILAMLGTRRSCRRRYSPARFRLMLMIWHVMLPGLVTGVIGVAAGLYSGDFEPVYGTFGAAGAGFAVYVLQMPFMAVLFGSSLYRARFEAIMRLSVQKQAKGALESG